MTDKQAQECRAAFEKWCPNAASRCGDGLYYSSEKNNMWLAWKTAWNLLTSPSVDKEGLLNKMNIFAHDLSLPIEEMVRWGRAIAIIRQLPDREPVSLEATKRESIKHTNEGENNV